MARPDIQYGTLIMHADTRIVLGPVTRQSAHYYFYRKAPTHQDVRQWAKVRKDLAMPVKIDNR